jgi:hypothetical protein
MPLDPPNPPANLGHGSPSRHPHGKDTPRAIRWVEENFHRIEWGSEHRTRCMPWDRSTLYPTGFGSPIIKSASFGAEYMAVVEFVPTPEARHTFRNVMTSKHFIASMIHRGNQSVLAQILCSIRHIRIEIQ